MKKSVGGKTGGGEENQRNGGGRTTVKKIMDEIKSGINKHDRNRK